MAQTKAQKRASRAVAAWLAHAEQAPAWLARQTKADPGTIGDFLNGNRWPKLGTQGRIEKALGWESGTLTAIADGGPIPDLAGDVGGDTEDPGYVAAPGDRVDQSVTNEQVLTELRAMRGDLNQDLRDLREDVNSLSRRVARLESSPEPVGGLDGPV